MHSTSFQVSYSDIVNWFFSKLRDIGSSWCTPVGNNDVVETNSAITGRNRHRTKKKDKTIILPGECLIKQTFDLEKDLNSLKIKYGDKYKPLLKRKLTKINNNDLSTDFILNNSIKIMQFNMLADGLSTAYLDIITDKTFIGVDKECLQWTYRGIRIIEEINRFNPDIITLEECDQLTFLMKYLSLKGYKSYFQEKTKSPVRHVIKKMINHHNMKDFEMNNDGIAIIYKSDKFKDINANDVQSIDMKDNKENVVGLAASFECTNNTNMKFLLIVTHLKSSKTAKGEAIREKQINLLLTSLIKNDDKLPIILCCDLNANPYKNKHGYDPLCYNSITNKLNFHSVYKLVNGIEPEYTTWKLRKNGEDKHALDYIFIKNGKWVITELLEIPKPTSNNTKLLIPNWYYPSDHFSIMAQLTWMQ